MTSNRLLSLCACSEARLVLAALASITFACGGEGSGNAQGTTASGGQLSFGGGGPSTGSELGSGGTSGSDTTCSIAGNTSSGGMSASTGGNTSTGGDSSVGGTSALAGTSSVGGATGACGSAIAGQDVSNPLNPTYFLVDESCYPTPIAAAGFIDLEPVTYDYWTVSNAAVTGTKNPARIFYSFIPANKNPKDSPVFVVFNGGPAYSTMGLLFSFGTGPQTLCVDPTTQDSVPKVNPNSWTQVGNLLYIDARQAGFSYDTTNDPTSPTERAADFRRDNFNMFGDAADFIRVMLRVLKSQPALQNNPVVLVGESYGGMRMTSMLSMLLDPVAVGQTGQPFIMDSALSDEMQDHFATIFRNEGNATLTRARIARQFGWQIMIQPALEHSIQLGSALSNPCDPSYLFTQRLQAMGIACPPDDAGLARAGIISDTQIIGTATPALLNPSSFQQLLGGVDPTKIAGLSSSTRPGAFRFPNGHTTDPDLSSWTATQGLLPTYDRYHVSANFDAGQLYELDVAGEVTAWLFLQNLLDVHTFITRAALDSLIIPEVIPKAFMEADTKHPVVSDVSIDDSQPAGAARPGVMVFTYRDQEHFGVTAGAKRTVRFPPYMNSGHSVTLYQPAELFADVSAFLAETLPASP